MHTKASTKKQILIVDDEKNLTLMLAMLLETRGYHVQTAFTAKQAFETVSSDTDLIILDLILPDSHGFEICRTLKKQSQTRHIPIIILSASSFCEDKVEGLYLGADDFIGKPCDHEELFARMEAVMRRNSSYNMIETRRRQTAVVFELREILDKALIVPYFQPIYKLHPFQFYGVEILSHPNTQGNLARPEAFFKAALQYGLYTEMEILSWSLAMAVLSEYLTNEKIFLNCSPYLIESSKLPQITSIFERNNIAINNVILEITERSEISNFKLFYERLDDYRRQGFKFAVDDVGGGYASLESIVQTKPEVVKIDRHIINGCWKDRFKKSVIKFLVSLCRENDITSVAEGIEDTRDFKTVCDLGVDAGQGFFLFRPTKHLDFNQFRQKNL